MGLSFGSINTGLPKDIVQQLVAAEKAPIQQMKARKGKIENKKKLVEDLTKLLDGVRGEIFKNKSARSLRELKVNSSDTSVNVTVDKNVAEPGSYQIAVDQLAQKSSAVTNGISDKDKTYLGVGYIEAVLPDGTVKEIYIDSENATLTGIAKLINGTDGLGMKANVVNDGTGADEPWKLVIALSDVGENNRAEFPNFYLVDGEEDLYIDQERQAQDAKVKLDGFDVKVGSNKVTELVPGVTFDLKKAKPGEEVTVDITEDTEKISLKINDLVASINKVIQFINEQNALDEKSDTSQSLGGDLTLQTIESRLRTAIFSGIKTSTGSAKASDIGLSFQRDGTLVLDQNKFQSAIDKNYKHVSEVLTGTYNVEGGKTNGLMDNLEEVVSSMTKKPGGVLEARKKGLESNITQIDRQIESKERMAAQKEEVLKQKFARLEETISRIKTQGAGLAGFGSMPNPVQGLG